jgi:hypothetical protein
VHAVPTITHVSNSGDASQTVNQGTAISAISYTASASATFTQTGSTFPSGLTVSNSGSSYTIYGTPVATGTFGYSLTASANGCTSAAAEGTITVNAAVWASTQTWVFGSQTWSDRVVATPPSCTQVTRLSTVEPRTPRYVVTSNHYYYSWFCVNSAASELCPSSSSWRVPTKHDVETLAANSSLATLQKAWGVQGLSSPYDSGTYIYRPEYGYLWTQTLDYGDFGFAFAYYVGGAGDRTAAESLYVAFGSQVRCVKD